MRILRSTIAGSPAPAIRSPRCCNVAGTFYYAIAARNNRPPLRTPAHQKFPRLLHELAADLAIGKFGAVDIDVHFTGLQIGKLSVSQGA